MSGMKKDRLKKNILVILIFILVISVTVFLNYKNKDLNKEEYIKEVLKTDAYSYLPEEAKDYIEKIYEETGNVLLTEKNKETNLPYLNPKYVEYLTHMNNSITKNKIDVEEIKYDVIPNETIVDYIYSETSLSNEEIPSKFDLRSVNGNEYVTPVKNQMSSGLCWAFATNSQIESYLLVKNNTPYQKNVSKTFSERQLDYATSINGILDYDNEKYGNRLLFNGGGNFYYATDFMKNGLGLVDSTWKEFVNNDLSKMELNEVFNYKNSNYEVNNTLYVPEFDFSEIDLTNEEDLEEYNNYLNIIKELVMNNGGAYVGTQGPTYSCSALNSEDSSNSYIIREDEYCTANANHAMHIIGWDDNYSYKYCVDDNEHGEYTSDCKNSVSGKGAWILKNSWGDADKLDFVYLAYDSLNSSISVVTDISSTNDKKWNNSYKEELNIDNYEVKRNDLYVIRNLNIEDTIENNEIISKIKFYSPIQSSNYYLFYTSTGNDNDLEIISTIPGTLPGIYTFDIHNKNINSNTGKFYIGIDNIGDVDFLNTAMGYFEIDFYTTNNNQIINTKNATYKNRFKTKNTDNYKLYIYSDTLGIDSNEIIDYELYDLNGNNLTNKISYTNNFIADNNVRSILTIDSSLETGEYLLKTRYKNEVKSESKIYLREIKALEGSGTKTNPYIITTPDELYMINDDLNAYYVLGNNIDLTEATKEENGIFYNEGRGWIPIGGFDNIPFGGSLDGQGYTIKGLYKNNSKYNGGLFNEIGVTTNLNISIKNINFEDCYTHSLATYYEGSPDYTSNEGLLAYSLSDLYKDSSSSYYYLEDAVNIEISNIALSNSYISGNTFTGGLFATIDSTKNNSININNIFSSSKIESSAGTQYNKGGILGYVKVDNSFENNANVNLKDILNIGYIVTNPNISTNYYSGAIVGMSYGKIDLSNIISNVKVINEDETSTNVNYGSLVGSIVLANNHTGISSLNNIYYTNSFEPVLKGTNTYTTNNILNKTLFELKDNNLITNWNNWEIKEVEGVKRIPMLKFYEFDYTKIDDIKLKINEQINIYDLITPNSDMAKDIEYEIKDILIATIDNNGNITGLKEGETTIHITSNYDAYENDVKINIYNDKIKITFDSNGGSNVNPIEGYKDDIITEPESPTKKYYKFDGWYTDNNTFNNKFIFEKIPEESITLYAKWNKYKTTINFNTGGGSSVNSITNYAGDKVNSPSNPTKEGYNFEGWYKEKELKNKYTFDVMPEKDITLYAKWSEEYKYKINGYEVDESNKYIKDISVNTTIEEYKKNFELNNDYSIDVDYKTVNNKKILYTGAKTKVYKDNKLEIEFTNIILGDINGDGKINYLDYVNVYNHIYKTKHPESTKKALKDSYLIASDMFKDGKINYLDYVRIYNKIKELKGGNN